MGLFNTLGKAGMGALKSLRPAAYSNTNASGPSDSNSGLAGFTEKLKKRRAQGAGALGFGKVDNSDRMSQ